MKNKIIIVGLNYSYNKSLAQQLANKSGGFFLDVEDYIVYNLMNKNEMLNKCGKEYLLEQEQKTIASCKDYENTIINFPYQYFVYNNNYKLFKQTSIIVYIKFSENKLTEINKKLSSDEKLDIDLICYKERNQTLQNISDFTISVTNKKTDTIITEIINNIIGE